jgi:dTDP-4-dehydrorhamnose reductase
VFGAGGFIGGCLVRAALADHWQVAAVTRSLPDQPFLGAESFACDITDPIQVNDLLCSARPDVVANLAASSNIDRAETEPDRTYQVNVIGAANIARACNQHRIRFLHYTTDAVFDGQHYPIKEDDEPHPLNVYGKTKATGDQEVLRVYPNSAILRISLAVGYPVHRGNSFLSMLKQRLSSGIEVYAPEDEIRTPIDIHTLCAASLELADTNFAGLLNIGSTQSIDRYALTCQLAQALGLPVALINRTGQNIPGRAARHKIGILDVSLACASLITPMPDIHSTILRAILC